MVDELLEPLRPDEARRLIRAILLTGVFRYSGHAEEEMASDGMTTADCQNVLRSGVVRVPDFEKHR